MMWSATDVMCAVPIGGGAFAYDNIKIVDKITKKKACNFPADILK